MDSPGEHSALFCPALEGPGWAQQDSIQVFVLPPKPGGCWAGRPVPDTSQGSRPAGLTSGRSWSH